MSPSRIFLNFIKLALGTGAAVAISIFGTLSLSYCRSDAPSGGPGMIVTFVSTIEGTHIYFDKSTLPDGREFPNGGSIGYAKDPLNGGKTEGAAPDGRQLPEYVDFSWQEVPNDTRPEEPIENKKYWEQRLAYMRTLPIKHERVPIRSRIPPEIIDEVVESNRRKKPGKLSDKALWVYFIWTKQGIKFHWRLWYRPEVGPDSYPSEGGDDL